MPLFNSPKSENYPRKWSEMSLDFKLMFVWHGSMMVLMMTGGLFTIGQELTLSAIGLVRLSKSQFIADCQTTDSRVPALAPTAESADPAWQRFLRGAFHLAFLVIWLNFMVFFYLHGQAIRNGSPTPTATETDPVTEHGGTVYVTHKEKVLDERLLTISMIGTPSLMAAGAILHFLVGVKLFPNAPT